MEDDVSLEGGVGSIDVEKMDLRVIFGNVVKKIKFWILVRSREGGWG